MTLNELIAALAAADQRLVLPSGFANPHSFRGCYDQLAFEPARNVTVASMLAAAHAADGATYEGYKGGDYEMDGGTDCWLAYEGTSSDSEISAALLDLMLAAGRLLAEGEGA